MTCFLAALEDCNRREDKGKTKAVLLQNIGAIHNAQAQYSTSLSYHVHAAELFGALGQRRGQAESLGNLAYAFSQLRDYQAAALCYQEALQAFRAVGDLHGHWQMCEGLGASHFCLGDTQKAIEYYKQALAVSEEPKGIWAIPRERIQRKLTEVLQNAGAVEDTQL
ncbi:hypothetical protein JZ751_019579 [Albula glossodonta]|uniref:Tetratricopeptide repeat protein 24 n=1 Tax=Albula glossodonta TaxID=121402 RepID=A0A8T2NPY7_9TELE|nr:hypothetical protein JZ751_019579 [Albula glossodonta]